MSKFYFSERSHSYIRELHPDLQKLVNTTLDLGIFDFAVIEGYRGKEQQDQYYEKGKSQLKFPNSKHNTMPSRAFHFLLYINGSPTMQEKDHPSYYMAIGVFRAVAKLANISIRCGGDWDGDFSTRDQSLHDLMHIELN